MADKTKRPYRKRKGDRLLSSDAQKNEIACDHAVAPFDRLATQMEHKWGIDRLPELVSPETATRYGHAIADLNAALASSDPDAVIACANNCIKGMGVMDAEAAARGHQPATGEFWEYEITAPDETKPFNFAILRDGVEWMTAKDARPDLRFFTLREVAIALHHYCSNYPIEAVKAAFPEAQITRINIDKADAPKMPPVDWDNHGDEIPF